MRRARAQWRLVLASNTHPSLLFATVFVVVTGSLRATQQALAGSFIQCHRGGICGICWTKQFTMGALSYAALDLLAFLTRLEFSDFAGKCGPLT